MLKKIHFARYFRLNHPLHEQEALIPQKILIAHSYVGKRPFNWKSGVSFLSAQILLSEEQWTRNRVIPLALVSIGIKEHLTNRRPYQGIIYYKFT